MAFSSAITAAAFSRDAFLLSWAWIALSIFATLLTLNLGTTENMFRYPTLLTVSQVQTILHISRTTAYKMIQSNEIKSLRIGRSIRIPKDCIVDYIRTSCDNDGSNELLPSAKEVYKECELMRPRKKGQQYEICYRCPGYTKPIYERFPTYEAANLRIAQIEYEKSIGEFHPPKQMPIQTKRAQKKFITVSELLDEYVQVYGLNHWGDSFLSCKLHRIEHYIKPYLGNVAVKDLTTHDLDLFYDSLQE